MAPILAVAAEASPPAGKESVVGVKGRLRRFMRSYPREYLDAEQRKPVRVQAKEMTEQALAYRFIPYHYVKHGCYRADFTDDHLDYMPSIVFERFRTQVNRDGDVSLCRDKLQFSQAMRAHGLPAIPVLDVANVNGELLDGDGTRVSYDEMLGALRAGGHDDLFVKPVADCSGRGAHRFALGDDGLHEGGTLLDANGFFESLGRHQLADSYLVQPRLRQHPMLDEIASSSVNTVRIDSFVDDDGSVRSSVALLRVSDGMKSVDNLHAGGFVINIDLATGALAPSAKQKIGPGAQLFASHPKSGFVFDGAVVPHWDALKSTIATAAKAMLPLRLIGWDVAITADGPVLVEANHQYDVFLMQDLARGLRRTRVGQAALETLGLRRAMRGAPGPAGRVGVDL